MSVSAREKVLRVRWAQHQVTQLQKKLIQNFPQASEEESLGGRVTTDRSGKQGPSSVIDLHDPTERYSFSEYLARRNFPVSLPPNGPSRALSVPNSLIPTRSKSSRSFVGPISGEDYVSQPFPLPPTKLSDLKKNPKSSRRSPSKGSPSPTRRPVDAGNSETVAGPNEKTDNIVPSNKSKKSPLMRTKNSVEALKTRSVQPYSVVKSSASAKKVDNTQGRMFRHRYSFQESVEPSPNVSRTSSAIPISKKLGAIGIPPGRKLPIPGIPRITSPTGSDILIPTQSVQDLNNNADDALEDQQLNLYESPSRQRQFIYGGPSRENLCIPSLLCTKKSIYERRLNGKTWVEKRFPKLADEVESWHKRFPFMKATTDINGENIGNGQNKHTKYKPAGNSVESVYNEGHHQPPPHKRGLVGVEISEFDADCAVFYQGTNGLYNPHLHIPPTAKDLRPNQGILTKRSARKFLWSPVSSKSLQKIRFSDEPQFNPKSKSENEM